MAFLSLPVRSDLKSYEFTIDLDGTTYTLRIRYNQRMDGWVMDIADAQNNDVVNGVRLQTNVFMLEHIAAEGKTPEGVFMLIDETGEEKDPTELTLGEDVKLLYLEGAS